MKLAVNFKLILGMIFVVLYRKFNSAVDKTINTGQTTNASCDTN